MEFLRKPRTLSSLLHLTLLSTLVLTLSACRMEIGNGGSDDGDPTTSSTVGGISRGVLTNASDTEVNHDSDFSLSNTADITIDGTAASSSQLANGMVAEILLRRSPDATLTSGTAFAISVAHAAIGPVTQISPLQVLGVNLLTTADTQLSNISDVASLTLGDVVKVSGYLDENTNTVLVTRLEKPATAPGEWQVSGTISNVDNGIGFAINDQMVTQNGVTVENCGSGVKSGDLVQATATADSGFSAGDDLSTVLTARCVNTALPTISKPEHDNIPAEIEGVISRIESLSEIRIGNQTVLISGSESYEGGSKTNLLPGAQVEIEGTLDTLTRELTASRIKFQQPRMSLTAPIDSSDVTVNTRINSFGMTLQATPQTDDEDLILDTGIADRQVQVQGFTDSDHNIYMLRVRDAGEQDDEDITLSGAVTRAGNSTFAILDVTINPGNADSIKNAADTSITSSALLNQLTNDSLVSVTRATKNTSTSLDQAAIAIIEIHND